MQNSKFSIFSALILFFPIFVIAAPRVYRPLPLDSSTKYKVEVKQGNNAWLASPTYEITPNAAITKTKKDHFSSFGFDAVEGQAQIRISMKNGVALNSGNSE